MYTMWDWATGFAVKGTTDLKNYNLVHTGTPRDGEGVWNYAMAQFDNILAVISAYPKNTGTSIVTGKAVNNRGNETALIAANADDGKNNGNDVAILFTKFSEDNKTITCAWGTAFNGIDESSAVTINLDKIGELAKLEESETLPKIPLQYNGANKAYILGYEGKTFRPNANMTRAEACTIFARLLLGTQTIPDGYTTRFEDVVPSDWFYNAVAYLDESGFFYRNENNTYKPNEPITRAEFVELANLASTLTGTANPTFTDVSEDHFYYESIMAAASSGLVNGYEDNTFRPDKTITRAEVVTVINRLLGLKADERTIDETKLENVFVDITGHWAKLNILMASNSNVHGSYYYNATLDGITESTNEITLANKHFAFTLSKKNGKVAEIVNLATGETVTGAPTTPYFVYLTNEKGAIIAPNKVELEENRFKVTFKDKNALYFIADVHDNFMTFEIDSELPKSIKSVTFANLSASSSIPKSGYLLNSMGMSAWTKVEKFGYSTTSYSSIGHAYTIYDKGVMGAKMGVVFSTKDDALPFLKEVTDAIDTRYGLATRAGGAYARDWEANSGDYVIYQSLNPENLDKAIALATEVGVDQFDIHQGTNTFRQGDFKFAFTESGTAKEYYEKIGKKFDEAGIITGLHTYAYYLSTGAESILSNPKWQKQLKTMPDTYTLRKDVSATNRNIATVEDATKYDGNSAFLKKTSSYVLIDEEIVKVTRGTTSGLINCVRGSCGTKATTHKAGTKVYHLEGYFNMLTPVLGSELFYHIADLTAQAYNDGGFNMLYFDAIDGTGQHVPEGHEAWYYHQMFIHRVLSQCERTPVVETSNNSVRDWNFRGRCGAWDYAHYAIKKHIQIHATSNTQWVNANQSATLGWFNFHPDSAPALGLKNTFEKTLFHEDMDFLGLQAFYYNSSMVYNSFGIEEIENNPFNRANMAYYNEFYSRLRKSHYFSDEVIQKVKSIGGEWRVIEKDGKYVFERRAYNGANLGNIKGVESFLEGMNPFIEQTPFIRIESRYSTLFDKPYTFFEFDETQPVGSENIVKTVNDTINLASFGSVITVKVKGTGNDGDAMLLSLSHGSNDSNGRRDHFIDLNFEGWREFILLDSDNAEYDTEKYVFKGITTTGAAYVTYRYVPNMATINRLTVRTCGSTGKDAMIDDVILQPHSDAPIKNPTVKVGSQTMTFNCEMKGGDYLSIHPKQVRLFYITTQLRQRKK